MEKGCYSHGDGLGFRTFLTTYLLLKPRTLEKYGNFSLPFSRCLVVFKFYHDLGHSFSSFVENQGWCDYFPEVGGEYMVTFACLTRKEPKKWLPSIIDKISSFESNGYKKWQKNTVPPSSWVRGGTKVGNDLLNEKPISYALHWFTLIWSKNWSWVPAGSCCFQQQRVIRSLGPEMVENYQVISTIFYFHPRENGGNDSIWLVFFRWVVFRVISNI